MKQIYEYNVNMLNFIRKNILAIFVLTILSGATAMASENPYVIETDTGWVWFGYKKDYIHRIVETQPRFPGAEEDISSQFEAIRRFIFQNFPPPAFPVSGRLQGTVFVTFVVEIDGSLTNIEILRSFDGLDEEAIRVVKSMPNWIPGKIRGRAVRTQFNMPIRFP